jgi:hypothetical protein
MLSLLLLQRFPEILSYQVEAVVPALLFIHSRSYCPGIFIGNITIFYERTTIIGVILIMDIIVVALRMHL